MTSCLAWAEQRIRQGLIVEHVQKNYFKRLISSQKTHTPKIPQYFIPSQKFYCMPFICEFVFFPGKCVFIDKVLCVCAGKSRLMITMPAPCCWLCNVGDQRQRACQFPPLECLHVQDVRRSHLTIHNIMTKNLFVFTITREPL